MCDRSQSLSTTGGGLPLSPSVKHRSDEGSDPHKGKNLRLEGNFMFVAMELVEVKLNKAKSRA